MPRAVPKNRPQSSPAPTTQHPQNSQGGSMGHTACSRDPRFTTRGNVGAAVGAGYPRESLSRLGSSRATRRSDEVAGFCGATTYVRGGRLRLPPRGTTYQRTRATTITAAAMATMATVEAATITRPLFHLDQGRNAGPQSLNSSRASASHRRCATKVTVMFRRLPRGQKQSYHTGRIEQCFRVLPVSGSRVADERTSLSPPFSID